MKGTTTLKTYDSDYFMFNKKFCIEINFGHYCEINVYHDNADKCFRDAFMAVHKHYHDSDQNAVYKNLMIEYLKRKLF